MEAIVKAAQLPSRWIHTMRHTYASRMLVSGANIVYLQKQLGHFSFQLTVDTYGHWIRQSERNALLKVDGLVEKPVVDQEQVVSQGSPSEGAKAEAVEVQREEWGE